MDQLAALSRRFMSPGPIREEEPEIEPDEALAAKKPAAPAVEAPVPLPMVRDLQMTLNVVDEMGMRAKLSTVRPEFFSLSCLPNRPW